MAGSSGSAEIRSLSWLGVLLGLLCAVHGIAMDGTPLSAARHQAREHWLQATFNVATRREEQRGLGVVASRSFEPGEVVLSSEPFAFVLFESLREERCAECFQRAEKLSRCASCKRAR